jgi:RimJ/RimL family protein N-acetyltransferase
MRLRLVAITPAMLLAEETDQRALPGLLGVEVPSQWPPEHWEPHVLQFILKQVNEDPRTLGWNRYILLEAESGPPVLIGAVGGFGKPGADVEIGYSTLPSFQRRGYGTEAAKALVDWLLREKGIQSVSAQTYETIPQSVKVMERCGMTLVGTGDDPGTVRYRRRREV